MIFRNRERVRFSLIAVFLFFLSVGCGGGGGSDNSSGSSVSAPSSIAGKTYRGTISSGSGNFASTGTFTVTFGSATYSITGDGANTINSNGTYTYSPVGSLGTATASDSAIGLLVMAFTYNSSNSGNYAASASPGFGSQTGSFVEL